jgi:LysM repeat protein
MRIILQLICICFCINAFSQKEKGDAYIARYKDIAIAEMQRSGVPAAITLAQGILESKYGESDLCIQSNNHFGIKCKTEWTGDKVYHDDDAKHECFRSYADAAASFKDHSDFLKYRPYYTELFKLEPTDVEGWAYGLKKAGYATEKDYPQKLLKVINDYNLNQYSLLALTKQTATSNHEVSKPIEKNQTDVAAEKKVETIITKPVEEKEEVVVINKQNELNANTSRKTSVYPDGIFTINHSKVIYAKEGNSLLALANQYSIALNRLLVFNEMEEIDILPSDTLIFLEQKMKKGAVDFHVVESGETLHQICQKEGVRMDAVMQYNAIKPNAKPYIGEKIYLRNMAPVFPKTMAINTANKTTSSK